MALLELHARSPFSSRLRTTFIPNDVDTRLAKSIIMEETARLVELEKELTRVKDLYDGLNKQHSQLSGFIRDHRRMIHPARRGIPDDILQEIFLHCVSNSRFPALHASLPPLSLTAVSVSWRRVALSTPRLWACLHIPIFDQVNWKPDSSNWGFRSPDQAKATFKGRASVIKRCLTLAKQRPLSLSVPAPDYVQTRRSLNFPEELHLLLDVLEANASSLRRLDIEITEYRLDGLAKMTSSKFGLLEDLRVSFTASNVLIETESTGKLKKITLFSAPHLKKLCLTRSPFNIIPSLPVLWHQLTHLRLENTAGPTDAQGIVRLLRHCSLLFHCSILPSKYLSRPPGQTPINQDQQVVGLHHLQHLDIVIAHPHEPATTAFPQLQLPALKDIGFFWAGLIHTPLLSLVEGGNLRTLNTAGTLFNGEELIQCLRLCPNLSALMLCDKDSTPSFVTAFESNANVDRTDAFLRMLSSPGDDGGTLCPRLETFQSTATHVEYTDQAVLEFIKAKQENKHGVSKLKSVAISFHRVQKISLAKELDGYRKQGLKLLLKYRAPGRLVAKTQGKILATTSTHKSSYQRYRRDKMKPGHDLF